MGIFAIDSTTTTSYSLKEDLSEPKTTFSLKMLDIRERAYAMGAPKQILSGLGKDAKATTQQDVIDGAFLAVRLSLSGWKNFKGSDDKEIVFDTESVDVPFVGVRRVVHEGLLLRHFRTEWVVELANVIFQLNTLNEEQRKN